MNFIELNRNIRELENGCWRQTAFEDLQVQYCEERLYAMRCKRGTPNEHICLIREQSEDGAIARAVFDLHKRGEIDANVKALRAKLKVAEDALKNLQDRLVSSVHDGTIDPYEALKIAENALAAMREEGCDPCNAKDGEGSSLRIGWEGEKEYCVVAKYRQDFQVELEDYDYHRVTGPLPLDIAKHWLDFHKRIRTKSEDPKILVREVSKWRLFDPVGEGSGK